MQATSGMLAAVMRSMFGERHDRGGRHGDLLRVASASQQRADLVANG